MSKYRSSLQIIVDILSVVNEGARKTHIMYGANLSHKLLNRYLSEVLNGGLVRLGGDGWYEITEKGRVFLDRCSRYLGRRSRVEEEVEDVECKREELENLLFG